MISAVTRRHNKSIFKNKKNDVAPLVNVICFWGSLTSMLSMRFHAAALAAASPPPSEGNRSGCSMTLQSVARLPPPLNGVDPLQRPPVNGATVALAADDLRCQVLVRAHERHGSRVRRLRIELHCRWATREPRVALGQLLAATWQDARDEGRRAGRIGAGGEKAVSRRGVARRPRCRVKETTPAAGRQRRCRCCGRRPPHDQQERENERERGFVCIMCVVRDTYERDKNESTKAP
jgi:hypothetical protein